MRKLVPVLMVLLAAASITAIYAWQQLRDVRAQSADLGAHIAGVQSPALLPVLDQAASGAPVNLQAAGADPAVSAAAPVGPATAATSAGAATAAAPGSQAPSKPDPLQTLAQQMLATPEGQEMLKAQLRATLPRQFPDIGKELGLSEEATEKLLDMLVTHQMSQTGDALNMLSGNGSQDVAAVREAERRRQEQQRANQVELAALLGDRMPRYEEYQKTLPMRRQVNQLSSTLGTGNNALSDSQSRQLIAALAAEQAQIQQDRRNAPRPPMPAPTPANQQAFLDMQRQQQLERAAEESRRMVSVARSHLNPQQLDAYRQMLDQQINLQRVLTGIGTQGAGTAPAPVPAPAPAPARQN